VRAVTTADGDVAADLVVANADYAHVETALLAPQDRVHGAAYWAQKAVAPSAFLVFLGLDKRLPGLAHHNFYFTADWDAHFGTLFDRPAWPEDPCLYVSASSRTDAAVAPEGHENLMLLLPVAPGLDDDEATRRRVADLLIDRLEHIL